MSDDGKAESSASSDDELAELLRELGGDSDSEEEWTDMMEEAEAALPWTQELEDAPQSWRDFIETLDDDSDRHWAVRCATGRAFRPNTGWGGDSDNVVTLRPNEPLTVERARVVAEMLAFAQSCALKRAAMGEEGEGSGKKKESELDLERAARDDDEKRHWAAVFGEHLEAVYAASAEGAAGAASVSSAIGTASEQLEAVSALTTKVSELIAAAEAGSAAGGGGDSASAAAAVAAGGGDDDDDDDDDKKLDQGVVATKRRTMHAFVTLAEGAVADAEKAVEAARRASKEAFDAVEKLRSVAKNCLASPSLPFREIHFSATTNDEAAAIVMAALARVAKRGTLKELYWSPSHDGDVGGVPCGPTCFSPLVAVLEGQNKLEQVDLDGLQTVPPEVLAQLLSRIDGFKLNSLQLGHATLNAAAGKAAAKAVRNSALTTLRITDCTEATEGAILPLLRACKGRDELDEIAFRNFALKREHLDELAEIAAAGDSFNDLCMSSCALSSDDLVHLLDRADATPDFAQRIRYFDLSKNPLDDGCIDRLVRFLPNCGQLCTMNLDDTRVTEPSMRRLFDAVRELAELSTLRLPLSEEELGQRGIFGGVNAEGKALSVLDRTYGSTRASLQKLQDNDDSETYYDFDIPGCTDEDVDFIARVLKTNTNLEDFRCSVELTVDQMIVLADALAHPQEDAKLNELMFSTISLPSFNELIRGLRARPKEARIKKLDISNGKFDRGTLSSADAALGGRFGLLADWLASPDCVLKDLELYNCSLTDDDLEAGICDAIVASHSVKRFSLSQNSDLTKEHGLPQIIDALTRCRSPVLKTFEASGNGFGKAAKDSYEEAIAAKSSSLVKSAGKN